MCNEEDKAEYVEKEKSEGRKVIMIGDGLVKRINKNYRMIVGLNSGFIAMGVAGIISPTVSALLHNTSTIAISLKSVENLLV